MDRPTRRRPARILGSPATLLITVVVLVVASSALTWLASGSSEDVVQTEAADSLGAVPAFIPQAGAAATPLRPLHTAGHVVSGDAPGLYGGTAANSCDIAAMQAFLATQPDHAAAWADALMIAPSQIDAHFASLTPVALQTDTAVTNHGFDNGVATPFHTVLQAGTAVLVDAVGIPRVRCYCGNPLQTPAPRQNVRYVGARWNGFDAQSVTEIHTAPTVIQQFVVVERGSDGDVAEVVSRPRATRGEQDEDVDATVENDIRLSFRLGLVGPREPPSTPGPSSTPSTQSTTSAPSTEPPSTSASPGPSSTLTSVVPPETSIAPSPALVTTPTAPPVTSDLPVPPTSVILESLPMTEPGGPATTEPSGDPGPEVEDPGPEEDEPEPEEDPESEEGDADTEE